jgi:hypothetical protein
MMAFPVSVVHVSGVRGRILLNGFCQRSRRFPKLPQDAASSELLKIFRTSDVLFTPRVASCEINRVM